ncbi:uncharacterized protein LOC134669789 [Cydia fagiglandana]|uniref:uncharacterized protein LOC134667173 n=1 Tax=Cydia fagiglandana TaxID=1458189 RepID=UPI002FEE35FC
MKFDGKVAKWQHLRDAEAINTGMLYFHKVSSVMLDPKQKHKMKVKYAAQTLSNTFAAILKMIAEKYEDTEYGKEVAQTSEVVRDLNNLFDSTNGPSNPKDVIKGRRQNVSRKTNHIEIWNSFLKKLKSMEFMKSDSRLRLKRVRCVEGYIVTINSLKDIWCYCKNQGFNYLNLRSLNQDALENLFGLIRQNSPTNRNPTCTHFVSALKSIHISGMNAPHNRGSNCEEDLNKLLLVNPLCQHDVDGDEKLTSMTTNEEEEYPVLMIPENELEEQIETDLTDIENQPIVYLSGYIAYRLLKNVGCQMCSNLLKLEDVTDHPMYKFISLREWWQEKKSLTYPSIQLCRTIEEAKNYFEKNSHLLYEENVGQMFCTLFAANINITWWTCKEHEDFMKKQLFWFVTKILIRRQCQILNSDIIKTEEISANAAKIAQLRSAAK